jgi:2-dehydro-3-deoxyglucarate aldolase
MWIRGMDRWWPNWPSGWLGFRKDEKSVDMKPIFRKRLLQGDLLTGTIVSLPCPQIAELLSLSGFDWLFLDGEHGPLCVGDIQMLLQAAQPHCPCVVRVAANDEVSVKQALDAGADGIIAPLVNDADTAARVVAWAKYPPIGRRSVGIARAHGYGATFADYVNRANQNLAVIVQVEHVDAVANIAAILDVTGIDGVFIGPYDLSASLGKPGNVNDSDVRHQIETVRQACLERGMAVGIFGVDAAAVQPYIRHGYTLVAVGMDTLLLGQSARRVLSELKP